MNSENTLYFCGGKPMNYQTNKVLQELKNPDRRRAEYILWAANLTAEERNIIKLTILEGIPIKYLINEVIMQSYGYKPLWSAEVTLYKKKHSGINKIFHYLRGLKPKSSLKNNQLELF
jgi:hypothetical protein